MKLSNKRVVYVHIEKCGGISIRKSLKPVVNLYIPPNHGTYNNQINGEFVFTTVRNPWARLVSWYHYMKHDLEQYPYMKQYKTFKDWLAQSSLCGTNSNLLTSMHNKITDGMKVYKLEQIHEHWSEILTRCGVWRPLQLFIRPKHYNKSIHDDYKSYYDIETRAMVASFVQQDAEQFKYTFDS
jgi:hypothetical protein